MTTPIWITGFNYGLETPSASGGGLLDTITGAPTIVGTDKVRAGGYAVRAFATGTAAATHVAKSLSTSQVYRVGSFRFWVDTLPSANTQVFQLSVAAGNIPAIWVLTDGTVEARVGTVVGQSWSLGTLTLGQVYQVDIRAYVGGTDFTIEWYVDNVQQTTYTRTGQVATTFASVRAGMITAATGDVSVTDVVISDTSTDYPIGPCQVIGSRPVSDGTHNAGTNIMEDSAGNDINGTSVFAYDKLDENPWTSEAAADYVRQTANGPGNYCTINFGDVSGTVSIMGVQAYLQYAATTATTNNGGCIIRRSDNTEIVLWGVSGSLADYSESSAFYKSVIVTAPGGGWTETQVNALTARFGYSGDANPDPYWLALMLEVAYSVTASTNLVVQDSSHTHSVENVSLTQTHVLTVQDSSHAHTADNIVLSSPPIDLVVQDSSHAHTTDNVSLVQVYILSVNDSSHTNIADNINLTQIHILTVNDSSHVHSVDNVNIVQTYILVIQDSSHAHTVENVVLSQAYALVVQDSSHAHTVDGIVLTQTHILSVADSSHTLISDQVVLVQIHILSVQDASHTHTVDNIILAQAYILSVSDSSHTLISDDVSLLQIHVLSVNNSSHTNISDDIVLTQIHILSIQDSSHIHTADNVTLSSATTLVVQDASHSHNTDNISLVQIHILIVQDSSHILTSDNINVVLSTTLIVADASHAHTVDNISISQAYVLSVSDASHAHTAENISISQLYILSVENSSHTHSVDNIMIELLGIANAVATVISFINDAYKAEGDVALQGGTISDINVSVGVNSNVV